MTDKPENPRAFPNDYTHGMTLRDYFAGQALAGLCIDIGDITYGSNIRVAQEAYQLADAMLKERSK